MTAFHEFDVALTTGVTSPFTTQRMPANEVHVNVWAAGVKALPSFSVGVVGNAGSVGLVMTPARAGIVMLNSPCELVLSDLSGALVNNLVEWGAQTTGNGFNLGGIYFF